MKACEFGPDRSRRIGLFGGTFNPIHFGHVQVAVDVLHAFQLDRIFFIPSALPPHKSGGKLAAAEDRLHMVRLALKSHDRLEACDTEIVRNGPSYSIDTVNQLTAAATGQSALFFILGVDAFLEIHTWKDFDRLFEKTAMVVMSRPGTGQWSPAMRRHVESYVKRHIAADYHMASGNTQLVHPHLCDIYFASVTPLNIASSQIRDMIEKGASVTGLVSPAVGEYIQKRRLFHGR
ncbi:MAG: nicotinate (nicotinamide) nucleotide adenylyltransferase [Desulfobacteraceae bacterium]|nr:MAG: nicotinate (nicotinamide) nucleotide adenylyltransferase [Desulfobacteraceae bacterium]